MFLGPVAASVVKTPKQWLGLLFSSVGARCLWHQDSTGRSAPLGATCFRTSAGQSPLKYYYVSKGATKYLVAVSYKYFVPTGLVRKASCLGS